MRAKVVNYQSRGSFVNTSSGVGRRAVVIANVNGFDNLLITDRNANNVMEVIPNFDFNHGNATVVKEVEVSVDLVETATNFARAQAELHGHKEALAELTKW